MATVGDGILILLYFTLLYFILLYSQVLLGVSLAVRVATKTSIACSPLLKARIKQVHISLLVKQAVRYFRVSRAESYGSKGCLICNAYCKPISKLAWQYLANWKSESTKWLLSNKLVNILMGTCT